MIDECLTGAQRVAHIVRSLRDLSRLRIGVANPTSLNVSVSRAVQLELRGNPRVEISLGPDSMVAIDPLELEQAIVHILRNAHQAIEGDQRILVQTALGPKGESTVVIRDEGTGIPSITSTGSSSRSSPPGASGKGSGLG